MLSKIFYLPTKITVLPGERRSGPPYSINLDTATVVNAHSFQKGACFKPFIWKTMRAVVGESDRQYHTPTILSHRQYYHVVFFYGKRKLSKYHVIDMYHAMFC